MKQPWASWRWSDGMTVEITFNKHHPRFWWFALRAWLGFQPDLSRVIGFPAFPPLGPVSQCERLCEPTRIKETSS